MRSWVRIIISRLKTFTKAYPNGMVLAIILGLIALLALPFLLWGISSPANSPSSATSFPLTKPFLSNSYAYENSQPELKSEFLSKKDTSHLFTATDPKSKASLSLSLNLDQSTTGHDSKSNSQNSRIESLNNQDTLVIPDILPHTDLVYHVIANGVKEEIILKSKDALSATESGSLTYVFSLTLSELKTQKRDDGTILPEFKIGDSNESFQLLPLYMEDANGVTSHEVALTIEPSEIPSEEGQVGDRGVSSPITNSQSPNPILLLTVTPSMDWLSDPARTFPIRIDPSVVKGDAPVAQWGLDEGYGTTTNDGSTNLNHLTITNATWEKTSDRTSASSATYIEFDGTGDYLSRTSDADFDFGTGSFSLSGWFKHNSTAALDIIMAHTGAVDGIGWKVYLDASGYLCFGIDDDTTSFPEKSACSTSTQGSLADSRWHHFEAVKSGTTSITIYLDGRPITTTDITGTTGTLTNSVTLHIGIDGDASSNAWTGFLDNIVIYNYERTAAQVQADALAVSSAQATVSFGATPKDTLTDGLVGWWKMDESAANSCTGGVNDNCDSSGNGLDGAWANATATTGKFGSGTVQNGSTSYVDMGDPASGILDPGTGDYSLSIWMKGGTQSNTASRLFFKANALHLNANHTGICSANKAVFEKPSGNAGLCSTTSINDDIWHLITAVRDGDNAFLYVDGNLEANATGWGAENAATIFSFTLGGYPAANHFFDGDIDEARVYNRALSTAEVRQLYYYAPGPVAYYSFDENTGLPADTEEVKDRSGNENHGEMEASMTASDWVHGKFGSALEFDGTDDYISMGDTNDQITNDFTVSAWFNTSSTANTQSFVAKGDGIGAINTPYWRIRTNATSGTASMGLKDAGSSAVTAATGTVNLADGNWHHMSGVFDRDSNGLLYVDGILVSSTSITSDSDDLSNSENFLIGAYYNSGSGGLGGFLDGLIDEVKIYNYARTQSQIIEDMNGGHPVGGSPVGSSVGYWQFDEGHRTTANDVSTASNDNDLTLSAASWTTSGKFGNAWNGTGSTYLYRLDDADFDFSATEDFSISGWFKTDAASNPSNTEYLLAKTAPGYAVYMNTSGQLCFGVDDDTTWGPDVASCTSADFYDNSWHHYVGMRDYAIQDKTLLYVDGKLYDSDTDSTTATLANSNELSVGVEQIIMDNGGSGTSSSGTWGESNSTLEYNSSSLFATSDGGAEYYRFTPTIGIAGTYVVNSWTSCNAGGESVVPHFIQYNGGSTSVNVDQDSDTGPCGQWFSLGTYDFAVGTGGYVEIQETGASGAGTSIKADAMKFTLSASYFNGDLDELKIYRAALTPEQVLTEYNHGKASVMGSTSTASDGITADNSTAREFCIPGDTTSCSAPVGWWKMDENTGTTSTYDSSSNNMTGTMNTFASTAWINGKVGSGLNFDGGSDYVSIAHNAAQMMTSDMTIGMWVYPDVYSSQGAYLIEKGASNDDNYGFYIDNNPTSGVLKFEFQDSTSVYRNLSETTASVSINQWQYVSVVYDDTNNLIKFYNNGRLTESLATTYSLKGDQTDALWIGRQNYSSSNYYFDGKIDDVRIYDYARTPAQIAWDYNHGLPIAHYQFDECTGSTVYNAAWSPNGAAGNDGTITIGSGGTNTDTTPDSCTDIDTTDAWYNGANGKRGASLDFDGTDDYVSVADNTILRPENGEWSVSLWANPANSDQLATLVSKRQASGDYEQWALYICEGSEYCSSTGQVLSGFFRTSSSSFRGASSSIDVIDGNWHHYVMVADKNSDNVKLYSDGKLIPVSVHTAGSWPTINNTDPVRIGNNNGTVFFDGQIDEVKIYNYALTAKQVQLEYNGGAVNFGP